MEHSDSVNVSSLNLVADELVLTIEQAAGQLEEFSTTPANSEPLDTCIELIEQIRGTLRLIQLHGADLLAEEILIVTKELKSPTDESAPPQEQTLGVLSSAFFILPRYLEYTQQTRRGMPILLIPHINELRQHRKAALLPESHFFSVDPSTPFQSPRKTIALPDDEFQPLMRRLRHMYQVGLLNTLQGKQPRSALGIMQRGLERLEIITGQRAMAKLWWLAAGALEALRTDDMELSKSRKMLLTMIDRQIKPILDKGAQALENQPPPALVTQLVFLVALGRKRSNRGEQILSTFGVQALAYGDRELRQESEALKGPSANTVSSVAAVLKDELRHTKEMLENASEAATTTEQDYNELIGTLTKVSDILSVMGLTSASTTLKEEVSKIEAWRDGGTEAETADLLELADALLYVESTVSGLENLNLSDEKLSHANNLARQEVIASSQLREAELIVIKEAEAGLALVKRALSSFAESNFDPGHIKNVGSTLNALRGGMIILNLPRAAAVATACVAFIEDTLINNDQPIALQQLLETFADAIIGVEYYLDALRHDRDSDDSVLEIAEESLQALGHGVQTR